MFIQLTRTDGVPVWLNAGFIVTVEPGRGGGSIVVPIGDGLDYEVKESPEAVLSMLEGVPPVKAVPVPPPKLLAPRPDDVSPEADSGECGKIKDVEAVPAQKKVRKTKSATKKKTADADAEKQAEDAVAERKDAESEAAPKKKRTASKKKSVEDVPAKPALPEEYQKIVDDLRSRKCRTVKRMRNAMKSFYGKTDCEEIDRIIEAMIAMGCILVESDGHVNWIA